MLKLVEPTRENLQKMKSGLAELKANPTPYDIQQTKILLEYMEKNFEGYLKYWQKRRGEQQPQGYVPDTTLFLFDDDKFIGFYNIRHYLNDHLKKEGGHIGGQIIPSQRGKGYGQRGAILVLQWCHDELGLDHALFTCNAANEISHQSLISLLRKMGGKKATDVNISENIEHRFWIKATSSRE